MKNKKVLIIIGIVILIIAIVAIGYLLSKRENTSSEELLELETNGDLVYYEFSGSASVGRKSMIYKDKNDNWTIITRYFDSGIEKIKNKKLNKNQKQELLDKINANMNKKDESKYPESSKYPELIHGGDSSNYAKEYISSKEGKGITPIDLEQLGYVRKINNIF